MRKELFVEKGVFMRKGLFMREEGFMKKGVFMRKLAFILLAALVSSIWAQKNPIEQMMMGVNVLEMSVGEYISYQYGENYDRQGFGKVYKANCLDNFFTPLSKNYKDIREEYQAISRISNFDVMLTEADKLKQKLQNMCTTRQDGICAEIKDKLGKYNKEMANVDLEWNKYKNYPAKMKQKWEEVAKEKEKENLRQAEQKALIEKEREANQARIREREIERENQLIKEHLDKSFDENFIESANYGLNNKYEKGKFESTEAFKNRLKDSSDYYFKKFCLWITNDIVSVVSEISTPPSIRENMSFVEIGEYDADAGVFPVIFKIGKLWGDLRGQISSYSVNGKIISVFKCLISVAPAEAQSLEKNGYTAYINPADLRLDRDSRLYPTKITIVNKADTSKKYSADVEVADSSSSRFTADIVFRGKYLWKDNANAAELEYRYSDFVEQLQQEEQEWIQRNNVPDIQKLVFQRHDGKDVFEIGKPFYHKYKWYILQNKRILFDEVKNQKNQTVGCYIQNPVKGYIHENLIKVCSFSLGKNSVIEKINVIDKGGLGAGIFDVDESKL